MEGLAVARRVSQAGAGMLGDRLVQHTPEEAAVDLAAATSRI
jgi:hypothetical protein